MNGQLIGTCAWRISALAACLLGGSGTSHAASYKLLYAFRGGADGQRPIGRLTQLGTDLFGVTVAGGNACNCGTVFRLTQAGREHVIHTFSGAPADGASPMWGMAVVGTTLYGTTYGGGANNNCNLTHECGTVFQIVLGGTEKVIHNFQNDEAYSPTADLLATDDAVLGTSWVNDIVFKTRPSGNTISFGLNGGSVGYVPDGGLVKAQGAFYGTTLNGGFSCGYEESCGSVYKITPAGQSSGIYDFKGGAARSRPYDTLIYSDKSLYGTTSGEIGGGNGTVFQLTLSGTETVLHLFAGGSDGARPLAGLTALRGVFYGTTAYGGGTGCGGNGCGTVFSITPSGTYTLIYSFQGGSDGAQPDDQLVGWRGGLIGTTQSGGGSACNSGGGCGTIFEIRP